MNADLLAMLTPEERASWDVFVAVAHPESTVLTALTTIATLRANMKAARAAIRDEVAAMRVTLDEVQVLAIDLGRDNEILRDHLRKQQEAFIAGLDLAQRTADAEIAELRATLDNECGRGEPPSEGWVFGDEPAIGDGALWHKGDSRVWRGHIDPRSPLPMWFWAVGITVGQGVESARAGMKAADAAVKVAT